MRNKFLTFGAVLVFAGCSDTGTRDRADTQEPATHREILSEYKALNQRLDRLASPLLSANADLCAETTEDNGIRWHQLSDYPEAFQPVSQSYWRVSEAPSVFYVLEGSAAARAGIEPGDRPGEQALSGLTDMPSVCKFTVLVSFTEEINAFATGQDIIVTSGMLRAVPDDDYLSLVLAHEISHNILSHHLEENSEEAERAADRMAVFLMARAGLDFQQALFNRESVRADLLGVQKLPEEERTRIDQFKTIETEVLALLAAGKPLTP